LATLEVLLNLLLAGNEFVVIIVVKLTAAAVTAQSVDGGVVVTVHNSVTIAILKNQQIVRFK
jgi:hypothetical protein